MSTRFTHVLALAVMLMVMTGYLMAGVPELMNYQGDLRNVSGDPLDTTISMTFTIYSDSSVGDLIWSEEHADVLVESGIFSVVFGNGSPLYDSVFTDHDCWLEITVGGETISPRTRMTSVPFSFRVSTVDGASGGIITGSSSFGMFVAPFLQKVHCYYGITDCIPSPQCPNPIVLNAGDQTTPPGTCGLVTVTDGEYVSITLEGGSGDVTACGKGWFGEGHTNLGDFSFVAGCNNKSDGQFSDVSGGKFNHALGDYSAIGGGLHNLAEAEYATISGGDSNHVEPNAGYGTVGGGFLNIVKDSAGTIAGGRFNIAESFYSTVGGGSECEARDLGSTVGGGENNIADGSWATISGGHSNNAIAGSSTVAGGEQNDATQPGASVGGGQDNDATAVAATVAGGVSNTASGQYSTIGGGNANTAFADNSTVSGGYDNEANWDGATVGGGKENVANHAFNTVSGGTNNVSGMPGATISGGGWNAASNSYATVGGGFYNEVSAEYGTISGGGRSDPGNASTNNQVYGNYGVVGGGGNNEAGQIAGFPHLGIYTTVSGGMSNHASANHAAVGGGRNNNAGSEYSTIAGGDSNIVASGYNYPTIGGGHKNNAAGDGSTIAGGYNNRTGNTYATVGGGQNNRAGTQNCTVGGGAYNQANGNCATVPGGYADTASGHFSLAAGSKAIADDTCSFVWADCCDYPTNQRFASNGSYTFNVRAVGGVYMYSSCDLSTGVQLLPGATSWTPIIKSDSTLKSIIGEVNGREILEKLADLQISKWNYKSQDPSVQHIGPMAQDFYSIFGLGNNEKDLPIIDVGGIALAAIQELNRKTDELNSKTEEIDALRSQVDELQMLVEKLIAEKQ